MLATARDRGMKPGVLYELLIQEDLDEGLVLALLELVFLTGYMFEPDELGRLYVIDCISDLV